MQYIVIIPVHLQILFDKPPRFKPQMFGDPFNVSLGEQGPGSFATIGALQTIGFLKCVMVQLLHQQIQVFRGFLFEFSKELPVFPMFFPGPPR